MSLTSNPRASAREDLRGTFCAAASFKYQRGTGGGTQESEVAGVAECTSKVFIRKFSSQPSRAHQRLVVSPGTPTGTDNFSRIHSPFSGDQSITQGMNLVVDFLWVRDGARDFRTKERRITFAKPVHQSLNPGHADAEGLG